MSCWIFSDTYWTSTDVLRPNYIIIIYLHLIIFGLFVVEAGVFLWSSVSLELATQARKAGPELKILPLQHRERLHSAGLQGVPEHLAVVFWFNHLQNNSDILMFKLIVPTFSTLNTVVSKRSHGWHGIFLFTLAVFILGTVIHHRISIILALCLWNLATKTTSKETSPCFPCVPCTR